MLGIVWSEGGSPVPFSDEVGLFDDALRALDAAATWLHAHYAADVAYAAIDALAASLDDGEHGHTGDLLPDGELSILFF